MRGNIISPSTSIKDAINAIDRNGGQAACICDENGKLLGIFTDGDMRRYVLRNGDITMPVSTAMNVNPITFTTESDARSHEHFMVIYPIIQEGKLVDVFYRVRDGNQWKMGMGDELKDIPLVVMAGGKGTRLRPYTNVLPKALIPIGDITITEHIINKFTDFGCREVYLILNHKSGMIKSYFNDIPKKYNLHYIEETEFLGTAGGLQLLKDLVTTSFFLSNCDVYLDADLACVLRTHKTDNNMITFVCAMKNYTVPYGVVELNEHGDMNSITEKPSYSFLTNTGVYLMEPQVIDQLTHGEFADMPEIARRLLRANRKVGVFPVSENSWMDIGQLEELEELKQRINV